MIEKEIRNLNNQIQQTNDRTVEGYAVVFDSESQDLGFIETISRSAIDEDTIKRSDVMAQLNHDKNKFLARSRFGTGSLELSLDEHGLKYRFTAPNTATGDELIEYLQRGDIFGSSFAFTVDPQGEKWEKREDKYYRTIEKIDRLFDISPVFEPAYLDTTCCKRFLEIQEEFRAAEEEEVKDEDKPEDEETETADETTSETEPENETEPADETDEDTNTTTEQKRNYEQKVMENNFSLLKAIRSIVNNKPLDAGTLAVIEAGQKEMRNAGVNYAGQIQVPAETRAISVASEGEDIVQTDVMNVIEPLLAKQVLVQAGCRTLTGLVGDVQYPVMTSANANFMAENADATLDTSIGFSSVKLSPKRLVTTVAISKQFILQDGAGAEAAIRQNIVDSLSAKLQAVILGSAAGSTTQPAGLFYKATGSLDTVKDFEDICDLEAGLEEKNVYGECKYIAAPKAKAALRNMGRGTDHTGNVWENNEIDGTAALTTSDVKETNIIYGDFSNYIIAQWGGLDLVVDQYTLAGQGLIKIIASIYVDAKALRPEAFAIAKVDTTPATLDSSKG